LLPESTGVDVYMLRLVEYLARIDRENDYRVIVNYEDRHRFDGRLAGNFSIVPLALRPRPTRLIAQQIGIPLLAALHRVDVVHSPSFIMPLYRGRARHVLTVHDMTSFTRPEMHIALRRSRPYRWAIHASIRRSDLVTVPSQHTKNSILGVLKDVDPGKIEVVALGVSEDFRPGSAADCRPVIDRIGLPIPYILFVGTIEPRKNLARLVEAYSRLASSNGVTEHLVIVGRLGWHYDDLLARIDAAPLRGRVHLAGYVTPADLPSVYQGARLFVYPSLEEGFGLPPLEAVACGVPTIAGTKSALEENLRGAARLVDPCDIEGMVAAMKELLTDERERRRLQAAGFERAARYRWEATAQGTLQCYRKAAAPCRR
jgi:glycosyltransferase involved in cell wall biosynthesis